MRALLDVNVLIALLDADHVHHAAAHEWLSAHIEHGWASCPLTQNGCIRILSQTAYPGQLPAAAVAERLATATSTRWHTFWPDSLDPVGTQHIDWPAILSSRQVTDAYLLALAVAHGGRLATFDRSLTPRAVRGAQARHLVVI
ncbi:MAG: PIN domain-containing protein [Chromatiales bacterium]|nr:PIN domain-containing protein [Chromatiales bacterium]